MIVNKITKDYMTNSMFNKFNWLEDENWYVVEDGTKLAEKIMKLCPRFDFVLDENGEVIDVVEIPKTEEEIKAEREEQIKEELTELDKTINRATEDLYTLTETTPYEGTQAVIDRKVELRQELATLNTPTEE